MPILKLSLEDIQNSLSFNDERIASEFRGLSNTYLLKIIEGVRQEGFCAVNLQMFKHSNLKPKQSIPAIQQWAKMHGLKVEVNVNNGICFFENNNSKF